MTLKEFYLNRLVKRFLNEDSEDVDNLKFNIDTLYDSLLKLNYHKKIIEAIRNFIHNKEGKAYTKDMYYSILKKIIISAYIDMEEKFNDADKKTLYKYMDDFVNLMYKESIEKESSL